MDTATGLQWINTTINQLVGSITELLTNTGFVSVMIWLLVLFFVIRTILSVIKGRV